MGLTARNYREQMQALLPSGPAWPRHDDATLTKALDALAEEFARIGVRAEELPIEILPNTTTELITDWERVMALPDECVGQLEETLAKRRSAVVAKLTGGGSAAIDYYIALALQLGYVITITEPATHTWLITAPATTTTYFNVGNSVVGERLISYNHDFFECYFLAIKPAHTSLSFAYV